MAERRMFAKTIVDSDAFLEMPLSAQALYFHLSMRADDDGFLNNAKKIRKIIGASEDDLKLLVAKRFVIAFNDGIIVIKHWRMNNYLRNDRYKPTVYQEELAMLELKDNGAYSLKNDVGIPNDNHLETQYSIGKYRLDKSSIDKDSIEEVSINTVSKDTVCQTRDVRRVVEEWNSLTEYGIKPISKLSSNSKRYQSLVARLNQYSIGDVFKAIDNVRHSDFLQGKHRGNSWQITFDWFVLPNNFPKVLEGQYENCNSEYQFGSTNKNSIDWDNV